MSKSLSAATLLLLAALPSAGHARDSSLKQQLLKLDPKTRLEQACDTEAMLRIKQNNAYRPDKVIAYTFRDPVYGANSIKAPGAARANGIISPTAARPDRKISTCATSPIRSAARSCGRTGTSIFSMIDWSSTRGGDCRCRNLRKE